jgi:hypothetical protein
MEANLGEMKSVAEHQEVPNGAVKDRRLAVRRRGRLTRRAVPARRKGRSHKGPTVEKSRRKGPECNNDIETEAEDGSYF